MHTEEGDEGSGTPEKENSSEFKGSVFPYLSKPIPIPTFRIPFLPINIRTLTENTLKIRKFNLHSNFKNELEILGEILHLIFSILRPVAAGCKKLLQDTHTEAGHL
jgi:hypothetical protein